MLRIIGGSEAQKYKWPWHAALLNHFNVSPVYQNINYHDKKSLILVQPKEYQQSCPLIYLKLIC